MLAAVIADVNCEDAIRAGLLQYQTEQAITQMEHAHRLGIPQSTLSRFLVAKYALTAKVARSIAALHPELRPVLHEWLEQNPTQRSA